MTDDRIKQMIAARVADEGYTVESWREGDDGLEGIIGRFRVTDNEDEDYGIFEGDEGELIACVVGAQEYHNERVMFNFKADGTDGGNEAHNLASLDPITP